MLHPTGQPEMSTSTEAVRGEGASGIPSWAGLTGVAIWSAIALLVMSSLMAGHWLSLPHPGVGHTFPVESPLDDTKVSAFHFLYADCPCSQRVLDHLLERDCVPNANETIVLIAKSGQDSKCLVTPKRGFELEVVTPEALMRKYRIESAPLLVVVNHKSRIVYSGGYTSRKQGPDIQDEAIIAGLSTGSEPEQLPVFGCAVSAELQQLLDPLRLKYSQTN